MGVFNHLRRLYTHFPYIALFALLRDRYAETFRKRVFKCQKGSYACRPMLDDEDECPTCGEKVDRASRNKVRSAFSIQSFHTQLILRLIVALIFLVYF